MSNQKKKSRPKELEAVFSLFDYELHLVVPVEEYDKLVEFQKEKNKDGKSS